MTTIAFAGPLRDDASLINSALVHFDRREFDLALANLDLALTIRESPHARWNRSQVLLSMGRYPEGFADYEARWKLFGVNPLIKTVWETVPRWHGEPLEGKRVAFLFEGGYGDGLMMLRYVRTLKAMGATVTQVMPTALHRVAGQLAPLAMSDSVKADYCMALYDPPTVLKQTIVDIPNSSYIGWSMEARLDWGKIVSDRPKIGIAWSTSTPPNPREYQRTLPLRQFIDLLNAPKEFRLVSLQAHDRDMAEDCGVIAPHYRDFADVIAVVGTMDLIVSIDTAALHAAAATGHRHVHAVLPWLHCWRWHHAKSWYPAIHICRQETPGDWASAFAKVIH